MLVEKKKRIKFTSLSDIWASWSFLRLAQLVLGLICLGYFLGHSSEWISLVLGLGLCIQAIYKVGCSSHEC
jgi:hypothetical protein